jgi:preprotein translocase, secG subunit
MYSVLVILAVIVAILLTFIVLIQESKGGGLASNFAASNQIMGVRKTTDVVEKATWVLAALLVVISVVTIFFAPRQNDTDKVITGAAATTQAPVQTQTPAQTQAPAQAGNAQPATK